MFHLKQIPFGKKASSTQEKKSLSTNIQEELTREPLNKPQETAEKKPYFYYKDEDLDGYGRAGSRTLFYSSTPPKGYVDNDVDCDDHNDALLSNEEDEDCDGTYAYKDCDDDDNLFQKDDNLDKTCDGMQFFLKESYLIQIKVAENTFSYLTLSSKNILPFESFFLSQNLEDDDYYFQIIDLESKESKELRPIPARESLQGKRALYLFSQEKNAVINKEVGPDEFVTVGTSDRKWGKLITKKNEDSEKDPAHKNLGSILLELENGKATQNLEVDPLTTTCPQGKWCSEVFFIRFPQDENRWLGYSMEQGKYLIRTKNQEERASLRLLKSIPE